jgi:hypothetical protein
VSDPIDAVEKELSEATLRAQRLVDTTEPRLFTVRPHPSNWSAAECLAHLSLSTELFLPTLRAAIDGAATRGTTRASMDWVGAILRWFLEPPVRTRLRTGAPFVPRAVRAKADAMAEFSSLQRQLLDLLHQARGLDLRALKIVSPFDKRLRYNVYSAFRIVAAHQRRHLWQAERAVEDLRRLKRVA